MNFSNEIALVDAAAIATEICLAADGTGDFGEVSEMQTNSR